MSHKVRVSVLFFMSKSSEIIVYQIKSIFVIQIALTSPAACKCVRENLGSCWTRVLGTHCKRLLQFVEALASDHMVLGH